MLQESHLVDDKNIKSYWKAKYSGSYYRSNSAGVLTLYDNNYNTIYETSDDKGRQNYIVISNELVKLLIVNIYVPNDHREALSFFEEVYLKIHEILNEHSDCQIIMGGDMNVCMSKEDCINRRWSREESILADTIFQNNKTCNMMDSFRINNMGNGNGFTWNRGDCYSRLDHFFISNSLATFVTKVSTDWGFDKSDHAAVRVDWIIPDEPKKGVGIIKVNTALLEDPLECKRIDLELRIMLDQIPNDWNDHQRLEFLKVAIRSVMSERIKIVRREIREQIAELEESLSQMMNLKIKVLSEQDLTEDELVRRISPINSAVTTIKVELEKSRGKLSRDIDFSTKANWYENGEKPTKYFLNLNKRHQKQKLISEIANEDRQYKGQEQVTKGIQIFYENLYKSNNNLSNNAPDENFFSNCPKLDSNKAKDFEMNLTKD
jgi:exonuclease III